MSIMGTRVVRVEDPAFLTRGARYTDDLDLVGALHLTLVRSPLAHARIAAIDPTTNSVVWRRDLPYSVAHGNGVLAGEAALLSSGRSGVMLHPTMIYGAQGEDNVQRLAGEPAGDVVARARAPPLP